MSTIEYFVNKLIVIVGWCLGTIIARVKIAQGTCEQRTGRAGSPMMMDHGCSRVRWRLRAGQKHSKYSLFK